MELSVIIPCLNEEKTLGSCIIKAKKFIKENGIAGEVVVSDNGSTDNSVFVAKSLNAKVVHTDIKGYGSAILNGIDNASGKYCIMADADGSYDFSLMLVYLDRLRGGYDLVMGNRFKGGIERGAMPFLHRYLGTPVLSFIGRKLYHNDIRDYNCGMRGFNTQKIKELNLSSEGMEFASEMIIKASKNRFLITEVPTTLSKDGRDRKPHLNTWRDGFKHLKLLLKNWRSAC